MKDSCYKLLIWSFSQLEGESSNLGDRAILSSMISSIRKEIPKSQISVISSNPSYTSRTYGVLSIYYKNFISILRAIKQADLIILGGGEFIQDKSSYAYLVLNLSIGFISLLFKRPICFYAIGIGNEKEISLFGRLFSRFVLKRAKFITVRDEESLKSLQGLISEAPSAYFTADPAIGLSPLSQEQSERLLSKEDIDENCRPLLCFSPRKVLLNNFGGLIPLGIQTKLGIESSDSSILNSKISKTIAKVLDEFIERHGGKVIFVPMYNGKNFSYRDTDFAVEITSKMANRGHTAIIQATYSPEEIQVILKQADIVVSMTLHALILSANTPMVAITYSSKAKRFMKAIGQSKHILDVSDLDYSKLIEEIEIVFSNKNQIINEHNCNLLMLQRKELLNGKLVRCYLDSARLDRKS